MPTETPPIPADGPWSSAALTRRALDDLRDHAEVMHARQRHPDDILDQLGERGAAWNRRGAQVDDQDALRAVRAVVPDYQPYQDLEHALRRDRIHDAIAAMQTEIAGAAYRDGYVDGALAACTLTREQIVDLVRDVLAADLPAALREIGGGS